MESERKNSKLEVERYDLEILLRRPSLRTGLPRRQSQVRRDTIQSQETTCGFWCLRGEWLQSFANRTTYLFIYGVLGSFYGAYYAYFCGIITTLEKRFRLSSQTVGLVAAASDVVLLIMCFVLSFFTPKSHKTKWAGLGILIIIVSTIISALPHFLYGPGNGQERYRNMTYQENDSSHSPQGLCSSQTQISIPNPEEQKMSIIFLTLAQVLHGFGGSLYIILGKSYREENLQKYQPPAVISLLVMLKAIGPAFGFWLASVCLKIFASPSTVPYTSDNDPHWIGAWWLGNLLLGFMLLIPATFMILFPSILPKTAVRRIFEGKGCTGSEEKDRAKEFGSLALNPTFNRYNFAGLFNITGFLGYFMFLPKYVEIVYQLSPSDANFIAGTMALICCSVGIVFANSLLTRYRPTVKAVAGWNVFVGFLSVGVLALFAYLGCEPLDERIEKMVTSLLATNGSRYNPVCTERGETLISPCECESVGFKNHTLVYQDCKLKNVKAYPGLCIVDCHFNFVVFMIVTCSMSFLYATGRSSSFWFEMKYNKHQKSIMVIMGMVVLSFLAFIPPPIIFGYILDTSCLIWDKTCGQDGNCWLYDNKTLRKTMNFTAMGFAIVGIFFDIGFLYFVKDLELFSNLDPFLDGEYDVYT